MGLIDNTRSFFTAFRTAYDVLNETRNLDKITSLLNNKKGGFNSAPSMLDLQQPAISIGQDVLGIADVGVSPIHLFDMVHKDPYFMGLFEQMMSTLFKNGYEILPRVDENGKLLGSIKVAEMLNDKLDEHEYEDLITELMYGLWGDGGGNVLLHSYETGDSRGYSVKVEPFLTEGYARVRVFGNDDTRVISRYSILNRYGQELLKLNPKEHKLMHVRYAKKGGTYKLSPNPAKRAVYWFVLKSAVGGANLAAFQNGLQEPVIASPDFSALTDLVNAMGDTNKVSANDKKDYLKDPIKYLARLSLLDDKILREETGDARNQNKLVRLKFPYKFDRIARNNDSMKAIEFINEICDPQMGFALRTSKGVLSTKDSKYDNAEKEQDNWLSLVVEPELGRIEALTEKFIMPIIYPEYDPSQYRIRFGRDANAEDLEIYRAKTERARTDAEIIMMLNGTDHEYDVESGEIVKGEETTDKSGGLDNGDQNVEDSEDDAEDVVENDDDGTEEERIAKIELYYDMVYTPKSIRSNKEDRIEEAYRKYHEVTNMSKDELLKWSMTKESKKSRTLFPAKRNIKLLGKKKADWTDEDVVNAFRTVAFISHAKRTNVPNYITKNWGYDAQKQVRNVKKKSS